QTILPYPPIPMIIRLLLLTLLMLPQLNATGDNPSAETAPPPTPKPAQFLYMLKLVPRLHDDAAWTPADNAAIGRHFAHLQKATAEGKVILAGRTQTDGATTFGLVIFEEADESAARAFMNSDPSVVDGIMTAELYPYQVALQRK
ncbi:MAG: YciI family protein, partial [Opitutus sp.]